MYCKKHYAITEYYITYNNGDDDFITEDEEEAKAVFEETDKELICQYFRKDWTLRNGEYEEDFVEVYFG